MRLKQRWQLESHSRRAATVRSIWASKAVFISVSSVLHCRCTVVDVVRDATTVTVLVVVVVAVVVAHVVMVVHVSRMYPSQAQSWLCYAADGD